MQWKVQKLEQSSNQNQPQHVKQCSYHKCYWKPQFKNSKCYVQYSIFLHNHSYVIRIEFVCARMSLVCHYSLISFYMSFVCDLYARMWLVCHSYVTRMCLYIPMSLVCCPYVICISLVCHPYITRMCAYVTRKSLVCVLMSPVSHSYVLVCHPYIICMYSYVIRMSLECGFTMNCFLLERSCKWQNLLNSYCM